MPTTLRTLAVVGAATVVAAGLALPAVTASATAPTATTATVTLSAQRVTYHHALHVTGYLKTAGTTPTAVGGVLASLQHRATTSSSWHGVPGAVQHRTGAKGGVAWTVKPGVNGSYRIRFAATPKYVGVTTTAVAVKVAPRLHLRALGTVPVLTTSHIVGTIHPSTLTGQVQLQKFRKGAWHGAGKTQIVDGRYSFDINPSAYGAVRFRIVRQHDNHLATVVSHVLTGNVVHRQLNYGDSGPDVLVLQRRLHALHYWTGPASNDYGWNLLHAVTVFEKVQGITPDGQAGVKVWRRLAHPKVVHLRHPESDQAFSVEVNLKKQVLVFAKHGKVLDILDTSTAGGYTFQSSSGTQVAITPTGHFTIQYKITGLHKSELGTLYDPSYFTNTGYAIHGEGDGNDGGEVPPYANSHGCVRITDSAVIHFYPKLVVGTSVWIYG
jgi:peptidoglycan hydrolase-like protein with peptidoglycan-binding domain